MAVEETKVARCPRCAAEVPAASRFCPRCGTALDEAPSQAATALGTGSRPERRDRSPTPSSWSSSFVEGRFSAGTMLADRYRIVGRLGKGGMGEVYRADDLRLGQQVALKFLPQKIASRDEMLARYHHEVRIARQVSHPNVCRVYDIGDVEGEHYISMEYVDGEDLRVLLRRIGRLPGDKAVQIARQLCAGLAAAHDKGVLHRDLKPANVMLDAEGRVRITDFGLAAIAGEVRADEVRSGTPTYMAPEQLAGKEVSIASDIYSLGLVLFEMFTGEPVYKASSLAELRRQQDEEITTPSSLVEEIEPSVERVILRCLARHPAERPTSAVAVAAALPGGDPLAAALAAGETPSPEMVAASGAQEGLRPTMALSILAGLFVGLALAVFVVTPTSLTDRVPLPKAPEVLAQEARDLLEALGHAAVAADTSYRFAVDEGYLDHLEEQPTSPSRWDRLQTDRPGAMTFWYRQSPRPLKPLDTDWAEVTPEDPPATVPGMAFVRLDPGGMLLRLEIVPPQQEEGSPDPIEPDWLPLLSRAGVNPASLVETAPAWTPPVGCDRRAAWTATHPGPEATPVRLEAGAWRGRPIWFAMILPWTEAESVGAASDLGRRAANVLGAVMFLLLPLGIGLVLARRNLRMGRCDRKGAFRLAAFYVGVHMIVWTLTAKHVAAFEGELDIFRGALGGTLFQASLLYVLYIALEPYVRRRWPTTLTSWTRVLAGRFRDPRVGADLLIGIALGTAMTLIFTLTHFAPALFGMAPDRPETPNLDNLLGSTSILGYVIDRIVHAQVPAMAILFMFLLLRLLVRRVWLAGAIFTILIVLLSVAESDNVALAAASVMIGFPILLITLTRFGLLAAVAAIYTLELLGAMTTADLSSWLAGQTIVSILVLSGLAVYGFFLSLAGRPIFATDLFKD